MPWIDTSQGAAQWSQSIKEVLQGLNEAQRTAEEETNPKREEDAKAAASRSLEETQTKQDELDTEGGGYRSCNFRKENLAVLAGGAGPGHAEHQAPEVTHPSPVQIVQPRGLLSDAAGD